MPSSTVGFNAVRTCCSYLGSACSHRTAVQKIFTTPSFYISKEGSQALFCNMLAVPLAVPISAPHLRVHRGHTE